MPYTPKQNALFRAAAHDPSIAKSAGIPMKMAKKMADEGVKKRNKLYKLVKHG